MQNRGNQTMINIICSGKIKEKYLTDLIDDYKSRISKYHKINIIELKDLNNLEEEAENILKYLSDKDFIITCDIKGKNYSSEDFAKLIEQSFIKHGTISFIIGSSEGISDKIKKRANTSISFSNMTMPHGLFRGVLLEQIYRSFRILNNESYHK